MAFHCKDLQFLEKNSCMFESVTMNSAMAETMRITVKFHNDINPVYINFKNINGGMSYQFIMSWKEDGVRMFSAIREGCAMEGVRYGFQFKYGASYLNKDIGFCLWNVFDDGGEMFFDALCDLKKIGG